MHAIQTFDMLTIISPLYFLPLPEIGITVTCFLDYLKILIFSNYSLCFFVKVSLKVLPYKKCGDVHEKFDFLENARFKTLEHLLKTF